MMKEILGIESIRVGEVSYTDADLEALPIERLEEMKLKVSSTVLEISTQIKTKQAEYSAGGKGAEMEWYISAKHALSINQRFLPYLTQAIRRRRQAGRPLADYFIDVAREELSEEGFNNLMDEAHRRKEMNQR